MTILKTRPLPTQLLEHPTPVTKPPARPPLPVASGFYYAVVNPTGRLRVHNLPDPSQNLFPLGRRTVSGLVWQISLADDLVCWVDADAQDGPGTLNLTATLICTQLLGTSRWPFDEPYLLGPALFTGTGNTARNSASPAGLSDRQLLLLTDSHAQLEEPNQFGDPDWFSDEADWSLW